MLHEYIRALITVDKYSPELSVCECSLVVKECFSDMTFSRKILENFRVAVDVNEQSTFWNMLALLTRLTRSNCKLNGDLQIWLQVYEIE